jgi:hypothetical protein
MMPCPAAGTSALVFCSSEIKTQDLLRLNNVVYSIGLINKQGSADFVHWFFESLNLN